MRLYTPSRRCHRDRRPMAATSWGCGDAGMWGCGDGCFRFRDFANIVRIILIRGVRVFFHVPVQSINDLSHLPKCLKYTYITLVSMVE